MIVAWDRQIRWFGETQPAVETLNTAVGQCCDHGPTGSQRKRSNEPTNHIPTNKERIKVSYCHKNLSRWPFAVTGKVGMVSFGGKGDLSVSWPQIS